MPEWAFQRFDEMRQGGILPFALRGAKQAACGGPPVGGFQSARALGAASKQVSCSDPSEKVRIALHSEIHLSKQLVKVSLRRFAVCLYTRSSIQLSRVSVALGATGISVVKDVLSTLLGVMRLSVAPTRVFRLFLLDLKVHWHWRKRALAGNAMFSESPVSQL